MTAVIKSIRELKDALSKCEKPIGLVPTMGALHDGHISLVKAAKSDCKTVILYIFVNPLQFGPNEDFKQYPRDIDKDIKICNEAGVDFVFVPEENEIYPDIKKTKENLIHPPENLTNILCGKTREKHFSGVATIIKIFFDLINPDFAYFGQKDLQQLYVINWLVKEFNLPITIKACPIVRESTGLAWSSRNKYLTEDKKNTAAALYKSLRLAKENTKSGIFTPSKSILESLIFLSQFSEIKVEYFEARNKPDLLKVNDSLKTGFYFLLAAHINNVRLIDNIEV